MGNIFGRWEGTQSSGAILTGSHCDAIPLAGALQGHAPAPAAGPCAHALPP